MQKLIAILCLSLALPATAVDVLSEREQADLIDRINLQRFEQVLPSLMRREEIDMWIILSREYNEDPVLKTMLPSSWMSARRHTMLVIHDSGAGQPLERLAVARYPVGELFQKAWDKEQQPDQWRALSDLVASRDPQRIAVNFSEHFALGDGISSTEYRKLMAALPQQLHQRMVSGERLAIAWLETRSELEMQHYPKLVAMGHELIGRAFSNEVITPGETTTEDVVWWLRQRSTEYGLDNWFHPTVNIQRADDQQFDQITAFSKNPEENVIQPGDLIHVDFGITYLRLNTDQQQHAYILKTGEKAAPAGLVKALADANRLQDIVTDNFKVGRSGNEVLAMSRQQAIDAGIKPSIYTHPLGFHGHAAGPAIGMWDAQEGVPATGDYPLYPETAYSIELNAASHIPEWGKEVRIMLEENAFFDGEQVRYLNGRQRQFHLVRSE